MSSWVLLTIGLGFITAFGFIARRWGKASAERTVLKRTIVAARTRKAIDRETQNLTTDELADLLRRGM
jgi:hypothetical protein